MLIIFLFAVLPANAISGRTTYQAKIVKPDGYPLEATSVNFKFTVLDPAASCVLYSEEYAAVNMNNTGGLIFFSLGAGTRTFPVSGAATFASVFDNSTVTFPCQSPGVYTPTSSDNRKIMMQFNDGTGWQTLPAMAVNAVPFSMYAGKAENAVQLNGKADSAFVEYSALASLSCQSNEAIKFNGVSFSCIPVGASSSGLSSVTTSGTVLSTGGTASAPVISIQAATMSQDGYLTSLDYAEFKAKLAASSTQIISTLGYAPVSGAAVATQISNSNLSGDVSGTISANVVQNVGGKTAAQVSTSVDATLAATASNTANTIVKRDSSGNFIANDIYANSAKINYADIYKPSTSFNIRLQAPTSLSTSYVLNLPTTSGTTGQVLSTDGSGNLSWINPSTGSVVSVSATAPLASTGGSNPTISITQATSSTAGYLSSADWNTFNNKQNATAGAIIATLGYTPADNAVSGTYLQKANNLSDLISLATARTNLGLGTLATANSLDLGSASATGIIAEARLITQTNVTSGTQYTKVTVDGKGRVTSGAQLSASDVNAALGYTPANSSSTVSSQWTTTGSNIYYNTGNVGIGTSTPAPTVKLDVSGSLRVKSDIVNHDDSDFRSALSLTHSGTGTGYGNGSTVVQVFDNMEIVNFENGYLMFKTQDIERMRITATGSVGLGIAAPTAKLHLASGTTSVAPLRFTSSPLLTTAVSGSIEYDGNNLYFTDGTNTRRTLAATAGAGTYDSASLISNSSGNITMYPNGGAGSVVVSGGFIVSSTANIGGGLNVSGSSVIDGTLKLSSMTNGSVLFAGPAGTITQDTNFFWDDTNNRLGVGTPSPVQKIHIHGNITSGTYQQFSNNDSGSTITDGFHIGIGDSEEAIFLNRENTAMRFYTNNTERVTVTGSGNVGIGTTGPSFRLTNSTQTNVQDGSGMGVAGANTFVWEHPNDASLGYTAAFLNSKTGTGTNGVLIKTTDASINTDILTLNSSGTDRVVVRADGNVGVGTTGPRQKLDIQGAQESASGTTPRGAFVVGGAGTAGVLNMGVNNPGTFYSWIQSRHESTANFYNLSLNPEGGNVGIGTTTPAEKLSIYDAADSTVNLYRAGQPSVFAKWEYNGGTSLFGTTGSDNLALITNGTERVYIDSLGRVGVGTSSPARTFHVFDSSTMGAIGTLNLNNSVMRVQEAAGTSLNFDGNTIAAEAELYLGTKNANNVHLFASDTTRIFIEASTGEIGIGTNAPQAPLDVIAMAGSAENIRLRGKSSLEGGQVTLIDGTGTGGWEIDNYGADGNERLRFFRDKGENNLVEPMVIGPTGNVGIGTTGPTYKLTVPAAISVGDAIAGNSNASLTPLVHSYLGSSGDVGAGSTIYILLAYNQTAASGISASGFDGEIYVYRGNSSTWNNGTKYDIAVKTAYNAPGLYRFNTYGPGSGGQVVTLTYSGTSYVALQMPTQSAQDVYLSGRFWGFKPIMIDSVNHGGSISAVTALASPYISTNTAATSFTAYVGIGVTVPSYQLHLSTDSAAKPGTSTWTIASDLRLKDIRAPFTRGINELLGLDTVYFNYKKDNPLGLPSEKEYVGIKAQDVQKVIPEAVRTDKDGYLHVTNDAIIWTAVNAIKDLYKRIVGQDQQLEEHDRRLASMDESKADKEEIKKLKDENAVLKAYLCSKDPTAPFCK